MSGIIIDVNAKTSEAEKGLQNVDRGLQNITQSSAKTSEALGGVVKTVATLVASGVAVAYLKGVSDQFTAINNQIRQVTGQTGQFIAVQKELQKIAVDTHQTYAQTAQTFGSMGLAAKAQNLELSKSLKLTKEMNQLVVINGGATDSAKAALFQFNQALQSGVFRGEEFNSVAEQFNPLLQTVAAGLKTTAGELRAMAAAGDLDAPRVITAMLSQLDAVGEKAKLVRISLSDSGSLLADSVSQVVDRFDKASRLSAGMSTHMQLYADWVRAAGDDVEQLGRNVLAVKNATMNIFNPIARAVPQLRQSVSTIFEGVIPSYFQDDSLATRIKRASAALGDMSNHKLGTFRLSDSWSYETDVTKALHEFRKLDPRNWAGSGFNRQTFSQIFNLQYLQQSIDAVLGLFKALAAATNTVQQQMSPMVTAMARGFHSVAAALGLADEYTIKWTTSFDGLFNALYELSKALTGRDTFRLNLFVQDWPQIIREATLDSSSLFVGLWRDVFNDWAADFKASMAGVLTSALNMLKRLGAQIASVPLFGSMVDAVERAIEYIKKLWDYITDASPLTKAADNVRNFSNNVIEAFFQIYDDVIAHSWWTDTIDAVVSTSKALWGVVGPYLQAFASGAVEVFKFVYQAAVAVKTAIGDINGESVSVLFNSDSVDQFRESLQALAIETGDSFKDAFDTRYFDNFAGKLQRLLNQLRLAAVSITTGVMKPNTMSADIASMQYHASKGNMFSKDWTDGVIDATNFLTSTMKLAWAKVAVFAKTSLDAVEKRLSVLKVRLNDYFGAYTKLFKGDRLQASMPGVDLLEGMTYSESSFDKFVAKLKVTFEKVRLEVAKVIAPITDVIGDAIRTTMNLVNGLLSTNISLGFDEAQIHIPKIETAEWLHAMSNLGDAVSESFTTALKGMPLAAHGIIASMGLMFVSMLFPETAWKRALQGVLMSAIFTNASLLADKLGMALTGEGLFTAIGKALGNLALTLSSIIIAQAPAMINAGASMASAFVGSFIRTFLTNIPVLGPLMEGIFQVTDALDMTGVLGLVGAYYFGPKLYNLLKAFGLVSKETQAMFKTMNKTWTSFRGGSGLIQRALFGTLQPAALFGIAGSALMMFGGLDGLFNGGSIGYYATLGGLLGLALFGNKGFTWAQKVFRMALQNIGESLKVFWKVFVPTPGPLAERLFNPRFGATFGARFLRVFSLAVGLARRTALTMLQSTAVPLGNWLEKMLFGRNPALTRQLILVNLTVFLTRLKALVLAGMASLGSVGSRGSAFTAWLTSLQTSSSLAARTIGSLLGALVTPLRTLTAGLNQCILAIRALGVRLLALAGPIGLVGRAFLRMNSAYLIAFGALATLLFAGKAQASDFGDTLEEVNDTVQRIADSGSANQSLFEEMFSFSLPSLDGWFNKLTAGLAAVAALWALILARQNAVAAGRSSLTAMMGMMAKWRSINGGLAAPKTSFVGPMPQASVINSIRSFLINNLFSGTYWKSAWNSLWQSLAIPKIDIKAAFSNMAASFSAGLASLRRNLGAKQLLGTLGASAAGAFVGSFIDGVGVLMGTMLPAILNTRILAAIGSMLLTVGGLLLIGTTAVGLVGIALFGPGDSLKERFRNVKEWLFDLMNIKQDKFNGQYQITQQAYSVASQLGMTPSYDTSLLNKKDMTARDNNVYKDALSDYQGALDQAISDQLKFNGRVMPETISKIQEAGNAVTSVIEQIANSQLDDTETFLKKLNKRMDRGSQAVDLAGTLNLGGVGAGNFADGASNFIPKSQLKDLMDLGAKADKTAVSDAGIQREIQRTQANALKAFDAVSDYVAQIGPEAALKGEDEKLIVLLNEYERFDARLKKLFNSKLAYAADTELATALDKKLSSIATNLKAVSDINFDGVQVSDDSLVQLDAMSASVKQLTLLLPKARSAAEHNRIVTKVDEYRTRVEIVKLDMQVGDNNRKQFKLKDLIAQAGDDFNFGDTFFKEMSDETADQYFKYYTDLIKVTELIKKKNPITLGAVGPQGWNEISKAFTQGMTPRFKAQFQETAKTLQQYAANMFKFVFGDTASLLTGPLNSLGAAIKDKFLEMVAKLKPVFAGELSSSIAQLLASAFNGMDASKASATIDNLLTRLRKQMINQQMDKMSASTMKDILGGLGLDFDNTLKYRGVAGVKQIGGEALDTLSKLEEEAKKPLSQQSLYPQLLATMKQIIAKSQEIPVTAADVLAGVQAPTGFDTGDMYKVDTASYRNAIEARLKAEKVLQAKKDSAPDTVSVADFRHIEDLKAAEMNAAWAAALPRLYATGARIKEALTGFNIDDKMMSWLQAPEMAQFLQIDSKIKQLEHSLTLDNSIEGFRKIQESLTRAREEAELLKSEVASTSMRNDAVTGAGAESDKLKLASFQLTDASAYTRMSTDLMQISADITSVLNRAISNKGSTKDAEIDGGQLANLYIEQLQAVKDWMKAQQSSGANLKADLATNGTATVAEMSTKIKESMSGFEDLGLSLDRVDPNKLRELSNVLIRLADMKRSSDLGIAVDKAQKKQLETQRKSIADSIDPRIEFSSKLKTGNFSMSESGLNRTTSTARDSISRLMASRDAAKAIRDSASDDKLRIAAQNTMDAIDAEVADQIEAASYSVTERVREAGRSFAESITSTLNSSIADMLMGKNGWQDVMKNLLTSLSQTVMQTFIDGMMEPLTGKNSWLMTKLKSLGSQIFGQGLSTGDAIGGTDSSTVYLTSATTFSGAVSQFTSAVNMMNVSRGFITPTYSTSDFSSGNGGVYASAIGGSSFDIAKAYESGTSSVVDTSKEGALSTNRTISNSFSVSDMKMLSGFTMVGGLLTTLVSAGGSSGKVNWLGVAIGAVTTVAGAYMGVQAANANAAAVASAKAKGGLVTKLATGGLFNGQGGLLRGAGHGTSDSINTMLSNGEFVVNAKSTAKHLGLLRAINANQISAFADGGQVGSLSALPTYVDLSSKTPEKSVASKQDFTINVTGDVSRQTRAEIQRMIPNIAAGVNAYNREKGNR